jgi:hypothetical protein
MILILFSAAMAANTPIPIEIWTAGDTVLVQRLSDAVRQAFQNAPQFNLSFCQKPGTIYVTVPLEANMRPAGGRIAVSASIGIAHAPPNAPQEIVGDVDCWDDDMSACGQGAVALAAKLH